MSDILQLTRELENEKAVKALKDRLERLLANADFRALILNGFCTEECARYVQMSVEDHIDEEGKKDAIGMAQAAGYLKRWIQIQCTMGEVAEGKISDMEEALSELRAEEAAASTVEA
jgi:hypothetical protein